MTTLREAAQQALAAMEAADVDPHSSDAVYKAIEALRAALAEPVQEPVEIKPPPNPEGAAHCIMRWVAETPAGWVGAWDRAALAQFVTQPRREWVSLPACKDKPHAVLVEGYGYVDVRAVRAIEAKLKEKNA